MKECKTCLQLAVDLMFYITKGDIKMATVTCEMLLSVLKSYKESC